MKTIIYLFFLQAIFFNSAGQDCNQMPSHFPSYDAATSFVKNAHFKFKDEVNTSKSSWIRSASFYSCDGRTGYFISGTDKQEYIHAGMPIKIWKEFKNADSFGSYYNKNIKHRYQFYLN
jgi:hypothetical protein